MNMVCLLQVRPVSGRRSAAAAVAARQPDSIIAMANGIAGMRCYRDDMRRRAVEFGRDPDHANLPLPIHPILAKTGEEAHTKYERIIAFPWDALLPHPTMSGEEGTLDRIAEWSSGKTLCRLAIEGFQRVEQDLKSTG